MAKAPTRAAVTATGVALLALIAASEQGYLMLTQAEGVDIVNAGDAVVDTSIVEGDLAAVRLTDAGKAKLTAAPTGVAASGFEIDDDVPMAAKVRRTRENVYPFDKLQVGQSFHVAKSADNDDPATKLASSVSAARAKYAVDTTEKETVTVKMYKKNPDGSFVKEDGKRVIETETSVERFVKALTRDFSVVPVGADDKRGEGARVYRTA